MNIIIPRVISLRICLVCCVLLLMVQQSFGVAVVGNISVQQGLIEGASVHTIEDGWRLDIHKVDKLGKYKIELLYNHKYELIFAQKGNFSQKIVVETLVPDEVLQSSLQFTPISLDIYLYPEIPGINKWFVENPIRKIYYNPNQNNFISETYFDEKQIARQFEFVALHSQLITRETDFLSKLTRMELAQMQREYDKIIEQAGKVYDKESVLVALDGYMTVTNEKFPNARSNEINNLLGSIIMAAELDKAQTEKFNVFLEEADNLLSQKEYTSARIFCNRALSIKPDDDYAKRLGNIIDDLLEKQVEDEQYENIIAYADNSLNELLLSVAAKKYQGAVMIKPNEAYPNNKLEKINGILEKELKDAEKSTSYKQAIKEAEAMYHKQFYEKSLASYVNALNLEPEDFLASRKIVQVNDEMTRLADKLMYDKLITSANKLYKKKQYNEAIKEYFAANDIKPDDKYASNQINIINQKLILDEYFAEYISNANIQFDAKQYNESRENYLQALEINGKDKYSRNRVNEIDIIIAAQNIEKKYGSTIAQADQLFNSDDYTNAKAKYFEASLLKPKEKYPKDQLEETNNVLTQIAKTNQKYQLAIAKADGLFSQKAYEQAKIAYTEAEKIKPEENYPAEMYVEINKLLADQTNLVVETAAAAEATRLTAMLAEKDKNYNETISTANDFSNRRNNETTRLNKELDVSGVVNDAELQIIYDQYINKADELFNAKNYADSRKWYYKAWDVKPEEKEPKKQIDNINQVLKSVWTGPMEREYQQFVDLADSTFRNNQYALARGWYNRALAVKSNESYPKEQLNEIDIKIAERMAVQSGQQFETDVKKAAAALDEKNYNVARFWYKKALELRPDNMEVKNKLAEIEVALK